MNIICLLLLSDSNHEQTRHGRHTSPVTNHRHDGNSRHCWPVAVAIHVLMPARRSARSSTSPSAGTSSATCLSAVHTDFHSGSASVRVEANEAANRANVAPLSASACSDDRSAVRNACEWGGGGECRSGEIATHTYNPTTTRKRHITTPHLSVLWAAACDEHWNVCRQARKFVQLWRRPCTARFRVQFATVRLRGGNERAHRSLQMLARR